MQQSAGDATCWRVLSLQNLKLSDNSTANSFWSCHVPPPEPEKEGKE
jgi:hypothetical protein